MWNGKAEERCGYVDIFFVNAQATNMNIIWELEHETFFNRTTYSRCTQNKTEKLPSWSLVSSILYYLPFFSLPATAFVRHYHNYWCLSVRVRSHVYLFALVFAQVKVQKMNRNCERLRFWVFFVNEMAYRFRSRCDTSRRPQIMSWADWDSLESSRKKGQKHRENKFFCNFCNTPLHIEQLR